MVSRVSEENLIFGPEGNSRKGSFSGSVKDALKHTASNNSVNFANKFTLKTAISQMVDSGYNANNAVNGTIQTVR